MFESVDGVDRYGYLTSNSRALFEGSDSSVNLDLESSNVAF